MQVFLIEDKKRFMTELLTGSAFDAFLLSEAKVEGRGYLSVTGRPAEGFFLHDEEYVPDASGYLPYSLYRETVFSFIKGERTPVGMMIMLLLPREQVEGMIASSGCDIPPRDVESLSVIIRFRDGRLSVTTGTSVVGFYPDKSLERALEGYVRELMGRIGVEFTEQI